jgi:quinol monooxygenase YgiN
MTDVWTHGTWVVKPGMDDAFVAVWAKLANQATGRFGSARPTLLRDRDRLNVFETFGLWPSIEAVEAFRASDMFRDAVTEMGPLLDSFETLTLDEIEWA